MPADERQVTSVKFSPYDLAPVVTLDRPGQAETVQTANPAFSWSSRSLANAPVNYELRISTKPDPRVDPDYRQPMGSSTLLTNAEGSVHRISLDSGVYYWCVRAVTYDGSRERAEAWSETRTFMVQGPELYTVTGWVRDAGVGVPGVTVTIKGDGFEGTATTTAIGAYSFARVPAGIYAVTASGSGYDFAPARVLVTVADRNVVAETISATSSTPLPTGVPLTTPLTGVWVGFRYTHYNLSLDDLSSVVDANSINLLLPNVGTLNREGAILGLSGPADPEWTPDGFARYSQAFQDRFRGRARVLAWVNGHVELDAAEPLDLSRKSVVAQVISSCRQLVEDYGYDGIALDIEVLDAVWLARSEEVEGFFALLQGLRDALPGYPLLVHVQSLRTDQAPSSALWEQTQYEEVLQYAHFVSTNSYDYGPDLVSPQGDLQKDGLAVYENVVAVTADELGRAHSGRVLLGLSAGPVTWPGKGRHTAWETVAAARAGLDRAGSGKAQLAGTVLYQYDEESVDAQEWSDFNALAAGVAGSSSPGGGTGTTGQVQTFTLPGGATMEFVWINPGTFTMGSPSTEAGRYDNEGPQHEVTIRNGFWLGRTEVTQGQWQGVMGSAPWSGQSYVQASANNPAVYISWYDVQGLVHALNQSAGDSLYRLPTEAEWEYACRAGTGGRWSFGEEESQLRDYAWYEANAWNAGKQYAQPVGTWQGNPWGLYDMHGNVYEWVQDWLGSYGSGAVTDPPGPSAGSHRVVRGGSFDGDARYTRSARRGYHTPDGRIVYVGARLLRIR
ncbi:MAG: SUMF1/EgtB/PvdO family nonheme iron enzyme [Candidatus Latescibacterota bacterium]|jgi:formylglycine-generating enzyme required for sulfatase activity